VGEEKGNKKWGSNNVTGLYNVTKIKFKNGVS